MTSAFVVVKIPPTLNRSPSSPAAWSVFAAVMRHSVTCADKEKPGEQRSAAAGRHLCNHTFASKQELQLQVKLGEGAAGGAVSTFLEGCRVENKLQPDTIRAVSFR